MPLTDQPPAIRDKLFTLHQLAMAVVNEGSRSKVDELFALAAELEDEVFEMMEALTRLQDTLTKLTDLRPATTARFCSGLQRRRRSTPEMT